MKKIDCKSSELHGVILYFDNCEALKHLSDEDAGKLFKSIAKYICGEKNVDLEGSLMTIFCIFQQQIDRNRKSYEELCKRNREKAKQRWAKTKNETSIIEPEAATITNSMQQYTNECLNNYNTNSNNNTNNNSNIANATIINCGTDVVSEDPYSFEKLWNIYGKKEGNEVELRSSWYALSAEDRQHAMEYVPQYVATTPEIKYRKYLINFIKQRLWESRPIINHTNENYKTYNNNNETRNADKGDKLALMQQFLTE